MSKLQRNEQRLEYLIEEMLSAHIIEKYPEYTEFIKLYFQYLDETYYSKIINWQDNNNYLKIYQDELEQAYYYYRITEDDSYRETKLDVTNDIKFRKIKTSLKEGETEYSDRSILHYMYDNYFKSVIPEEYIYLQNDQKRLYISLSKLINNLKGREISFSALFKYLGHAKVIEENKSISYLQDMRISVTQPQEYWTIDSTLGRYDNAYTYNYELETDAGIYALEKLFENVHPAGFVYIFSIPVFPPSGNPKVSQTVTISTKYNVYQPINYTGIYTFSGMMNLYVPDTLTHITCLSSMSGIISTQYKEAV